MPIITTTIPSSGGNYALRRDVELTEDELKKIDEKAYEEHRNIMAVCVKDARIHDDGDPMGELTSAQIASALFAMRARPVHYMREEAAKEKWLAQQKAKKTLCAPPKDDVKKDLSLL